MIGDHDEFVPVAVLVPGTHLKRTRVLYNHRPAQGQPLKPQAPPGSNLRRLPRPQTSGGSPANATFPNPSISAETSAIARSAAAPSGPFATSATPCPLAR